MLPVVGREPWRDKAVAVLVHSFLPSPESDSALSGTRMMPGIQGITLAERGMDPLLMKRKTRVYNVDSVQCRLISLL